MIHLVVIGKPAPQGSKRHLGKGVMIEMSKNVKPWREAVRSTAVEAMAGQPALTVPVRVAMVFTAVRPKYHFRSGANANVLRDNAPMRPAVVPDLSKLARSTEDALTDAGVWRDDCLVVEYSRLAKVWAGEDPDALLVPGVVIRIYPLVESETNQ